MMSISAGDTQEETRCARYESAAIVQGAKSRARQSLPVCVGSLPYCVGCAGLDAKPSLLACGASVHTSVLKSIAMYILYSSMHCVLIGCDACAALKHALHLKIGCGRSTTACATAVTGYSFLFLLFFFFLFYYYYYYYFPVVSLRTDLPKHVDEIYIVSSRRN